MGWDAPTGMYWDMGPGNSHEIFRSLQSEAGIPSGGDIVSGKRGPPGRRAMTIAVLIVLQILFTPVTTAGLITVEAGEIIHPALK